MSAQDNTELDDDAIEFVVLFKNDIGSSDQLSDNKLSMSMDTKMYLGGMDKNYPYSLNWLTNTYSYDIENEYVSK